MPNDESSTPTSNHSNLEQGPSVSDADPSEANGQTVAAPVHPPIGFWGALREWADAMIIAFLLVMFIRAFAIELYKIPSGSMTPTLVGDYQAEYDYNEDGLDDLLIYSGLPPQNEPLPRRARVQVFLGVNDAVFPWKYIGKVTLKETQRLETAELFKIRYDRILVNKFAYWFSPPNRGDLVVFKVPIPEWNRNKPIYIKRAVGLGGERVAFELVQGEEMANIANRGRLTIDGRPVTDPPIFRRLRYTWDAGPQWRPESDWPQGLEYERNGRFAAANVPEDHIFVLGDNTDSSSDGRFWGTVPCNNLKGRAFLRYFPFGKFSFLK